MFLKYDDTVHPCLQLHIQLLSLLIKHRDGDKSTKSNISAIWFLTEPNGDLHSFPCFYPCLCYQFSTQCSRSALKKKKEKYLNSHFSVQNVSVDFCSEKNLKLLQSLREPYLIWVPAVSLTPPLSTRPLTASPQTAEASLLSFSPPGLLFFQWMSTLFYPFRALHKYH